MEYWKKIFTQIFDFLKGLSAAKKAAMVFTGVAIAIGMSALFYWAGETTYQPLMTNLGAEDSSNIIRILREKNIPFKVDPGGKNISIPPESVYDLRLELATMGLPQSSVVGYEIFDKQSLGTTTFVQKVNQKRAREGELMRTINTIKGVKRSRVHLAMPEKSTFVEDQKKSSASVVLDLEPGTVLNEKQIYGIGNLVSHAVEGMELNDVLITDSSGKTLSKNSGDEVSSMTIAQSDFRAKREREIEGRIQEMLSRVVGEGKVVAKVSADMDFAQVSETQTIYDQDGSAVRSTERRNDNMNGVRPGPQGLVGAASNTPGESPVANRDIRTETNKGHEVTNYEVPQTVRRTTHEVGALKRLSVAVVVDGKTVKEKDAEGVVQTKVIPWTPEKLKEFESVVASAAGIDPKRGDTIEIKNLEFTREDFEEAAKVIAESERKSYIMNMIVYLVIGLTIVLFFLFVVRPFIKWITENTIDSVDTFLPQTIEELEKMQKNTALPGLEDSIPVLPEKIDPEKVEGEMIKEKIITLVDSNPHKAALILRDWLHIDPKKLKLAAEAAAAEAEGKGGGSGKTA